MDVLSETSLFYRWGFRNLWNSRKKITSFLNELVFTCRAAEQSAGDCPDLAYKLQVFMSTFFGSLPPERRGAEAADDDRSTVVGLCRSSFVSAVQATLCCRWSSSWAANTGVRCPSSSSPRLYPNCPRGPCWGLRVSLLSGDSQYSQLSSVQPLSLHWTWTHFTSLSSWFVGKCCAAPWSPTRCCWGEPLSASCWTAPSASPMWYVT